MNRDVHLLRSRSKLSVLLFAFRNIGTHSESLVHTMENNLRCFVPSHLRLKDLEFWLFRLFNRNFILKYKLLSANHHPEGTEILLIGPKIWHCPAYEALLPEK